MKTEYRTIDNGGLWGGRLHLFDSLPSTNRWAMDNLPACRHGDVISAAAQTAGRGRFARTWLSPGNRGLALSTVLRPPALKSELIPATGFVAALALRETLAAFEIEAMLKWPNDVVTGDRKISGILAELDAATETVVLGIGLNVNVTGDDLRGAGLEGTATSMLISRNRKFVVEDVRARLIPCLQAWFDRITREGFARVTDEWARHDWLAGHAVEIQATQGAVRGVYAGMDAAGALCLFDSAGARHVFPTGDVARLRTPERNQPSACQPHLP